MVFPKNNLPSGSQYWAREVEKQVTNLDAGFRRSEINNTTRDSQLQVTASQALIAAQAATQAAADATAAINGLGSLDEATSSYKINAANVTVGSLSGDRITGGTIIGTQIQTATTGRRLKLESTQASFWDENNNYTGSILGAGTSRGATVEISSGSTGRVGVWSGGVFINATGGVEASFDSGGLNMSNGGISITNGGINTNSGNISVGNGTISTNGCSMGSSNISALSGTITGGTVAASNFSGTYNTTIAGNTTSSFAGNVFINTSGNMFRSTATSSREAKDNIQPYTFDTDAFISVSPVTFNYKPDAVSDPEETQISQLGFILEDFEDAGVGEYLTIPTNNMDKYKGLRYDKLYMLLHKVVQEQNETIKDLTARLEALEAK